MYTKRLYDEIQMQQNMDDFDLTATSENVGRKRLRKLSDKHAPLTSPQNQEQDDTFDEFLGPKSCMSPQLPTHDTVFKDRFRHKDSNINSDKHQTMYQQPKLIDAFNCFVSDLVGFICSSAKPATGLDVNVKRIKAKIIQKKEVISSNWDKNFIHLLESLPNFRYYKIFPELINTHESVTLNEPDAPLSTSNYKCAACSRTNHSEACRVVLYGQRYDSDAFWDGEIEDNPSPSAPFEKVEFSVGPRCRKRVELYHRRHHYKFYLVNKLKCLLKSNNENFLREGMLRQLYDEFKALNNEE